ncbi:hypothetical protein IF1G_10887 [Cordyceps javanica]|uniref:Uncharacterized protein n=1 Tax=Cordyceps javanica TaxID=43265 RepID=A0A545VJX0_9HYPO|nr:hypothetical protein IF1G_10887 [Cordyceps javanica]TQW01970.1 hypothetical protein IF2G_10541 [Cordyceps javanica]
MASPHGILDAEYDDKNRTLTIEFPSYRLAHSNVEDLNSGSFDFVFETEYSQKQIKSCKDQIGHGGCVSYVPSDHLQRRFDCVPFNRYWPTIWHDVMIQRNLKSPSEYGELSTPEPGVSITDDDTNDIFFNARTSQDDEPRGRMLWPGEASSSTKQKREPSELLTSGEDSQMKGSWVGFFQNRFTTSLLAWTRYGRIAEHRRELSTKQGLSEGIVPKCDGSCDLHCKDIKETPRPEEVDKFLATREEDWLVEV